MTGEMRGRARLAAVIGLLDFQTLAWPRIECALHVERAGTENPRHSERRRELVGRHCDNHATVGFG